MSLVPKQQQLIDGRWLDGHGEVFDKHDPVAGARLWRACAASPGQVTEAVAAARRAFPDWARSDYSSRVALIEAFRDQLDAHRETLAETIARETGKPLWEARTEVGAMIGKVAISQAGFDERTGERSKEIPGGRAVLRHRPHGVLAVFGPYNFPGHLPNGHIVPALLAGNTVVFKPSDLTPATADLTLQCWQAAGVADGVINLVQGGIAVGQALAGNPDIDGLLFTGSAATGRHLHAQFGGQVDKILALELGGNNPLVVAEGFDIAAAVVVIIQSAFISGGQRCTCARRLLVPEGEAGDALIAALTAALADLRVGDPMAEGDRAPFYGGLATPAAAEALVQVADQLQAQGANVLSKLRILEPGTSLLSPGLIDVTGLELPDEEHFGPLLKISRYRDWDAAIAEANNTRYGLAAGLLGGSADDWQDFRLRIRAGIVNWNRQTTGAASDAPFGGIGDSGNHRPSAWYAADYCAWPMASMEADVATVPDTLPPGLSLSSIETGTP